MAVSEPQKLAIIKYRQEKCDQLAVDVPKGKKDEYKAKAACLGLSLSKLIQRSIESYGEDFISPPLPSTPAEKLSSEQKRLVEEFNQLPLNAQKHFLQAFKAINQSKGGGDNGDN